MESQAIKRLRADTRTMAKLQSDEGMPWRGVKEALKTGLPETIDNRDQFAYDLVPRALTDVFGGQQDHAWESYKNPRTGATWVRSRG